MPYWYLDRRWFWFIVWTCISLTLVASTDPPPNRVLPKIQCHDPSIGAHSKHARYVITGHGSSSGGVGNSIVFFPNAFIFAALTGRNLLIGENSALTEMCSVLTCGYTRVSVIAKSLSGTQAKGFPRGRAIKVFDMGEHFRGEAIINDPNVFVDGFLPHLTGWYQYLDNNTAPALECLKKITGCESGSDVSCVSRYALQSWMRGPFVNAFTEMEKDRIKGVPPHVMHGLLTLPHSYAPRFDVSIHLRIQFRSFEDGLSASSPEYKAEVAKWLNDSLATELFGVMEQKLRAQLNQSSDPNWIQLDDESSQANRDLTTDPYLVFVAADNQEVKEAFVEYLHSDACPVSKIENLHIMYTDAKEIVHVKSIHNVKQLTAGEGILDLAFDWYALSLSNVILNYRSGGKLLSTFVHSAAWTSGNMEPTNITAPIGRGIGTKAFFYNIKYHTWDMFWFY